jgi:hypothetical protein
LPPPTLTSRMSIWVPWETSQVSMASAGWKLEVVLRWTSPLLTVRGLVATRCSGWPATCCKGRLVSEVWAAVWYCRPMRRSRVSGSLVRNRPGWVVVIWCRR